MESLGHIDVTPPLLGPAREQLERRLEPDCPWVLCRDGCCLRLEDDDRTLAAEWLVELVIALEGHRLEGLVVVASADGEVFTVRAVRNRVYDKVLRRSDGRAGVPMARVIDLQPRLQSRR